MRDFKDVEVSTILDSLFSPEAGLVGLFVASFIAATLLPLSSEAVLFGFLTFQPAYAVPAIALATLGNTAGGMTTYWIGRLLPERMRAKLDARTLRWITRYGTPATFFAWLPVVGDALCLAAGWLRLAWPAALVFMATGRLARYLVIAQGALG
ncbi:MAG: DedA family protein [Betaproteobacteria bacterium]|nr:DedA family protein [Betaproteobacteria bacterium]